MKLFISLVIGLITSGCSMFDDQSRYNRPRVDVSPNSQGIEVPSALCDIIDANINTGSIQLDSYSGRCRVRTYNYR